MKKIQKNILMLATLLMTGAALISCDNVDNAVTDQPTNNSRTYIMIVEATMGGGAQTRALEQDGQTNDIKATWSIGDKVVVYGEIENDYQSLGVLTAQSNGKTTLLTGQLDADKVPELGDVVDLLYLSGKSFTGVVDYTCQKGTFDDIATNFDFAMASVEVIEVKNKEIKTARATLKNPQSIIKFTLKDKDGEAIPAKSFNICFTNGNYDQLVTTYDQLSEDRFITGDIPISRSNLTADDANQIWAALTTQNLICGEVDEDEGIDVNLVASDGNSVYSYRKSGFTLSTSKFYDFPVTMKKLSLIPEPTSQDLVSIGSVVSALKNNYTKLSLEQAWKLAKAQSAINSNTVYVLYEFTGSSTTTVAHYASSGDSSPSDNTASLQNYTSFLGLLGNNCGYYVEP